MVIFEAFLSRFVYSRSYSPRQSRHSRYRKRSLSRSPQSNRKRHVSIELRPRIIAALSAALVSPSSSQQYNPSPCRVLGVFGLSLYTGEKDLRELFGKYGPMEEVQIVYDHQVSGVVVVMGPFRPLCVGRHVMRKTLTPLV